MKATAHRTGTSGYTHTLAFRHHRITIDEPEDLGGVDAGPSPQELLAGSLAACTAITLEMYAERKGWTLPELEVECVYTPAERSGPTHFRVTVRLPAGVDPEQVERLRVIAAKCPVHRTLAGEVVFDERIEIAEPATPTG